MKIIISGGGTGGHIFPAVSIANAVKALDPEAEILFVGALGRMEMQRVPAAGYDIVGLPVRGLIRPLWSPKNIGVLWDFLRAKYKVKSVIRNFRPAAYEMHIPCLIQEQNSFAGLTNKTLANKADKICVAYSGMDRFFPSEKIMMTGNPVRQNLLNPSLSRAECCSAFGLDPSRPVVLIVGGSLGARTINESVLSSLDRIRKSPVQFIWQTGSYYKEQIAAELAKTEKPSNLYVTDFISAMDEAYKAADLVISRAGASSISELCLLGKASILVPSPNVAEDHQTHNAMALVKREAAQLVKDSEAPDRLIRQAIETVTNPAALTMLGQNARAMAFKDSAEVIAKEVIKLANAKHKK